MKACPFCNIKDRIIKENDVAVVILSNPRKVPGHFLVIPKRHIEKPWEVTNKELAGIFDLIKIVQQKITEKLSDGCDIRQNYRPFMKQSHIKVDHVHYHVIPRDNLDTIYQRVEKYDTDLFQPLSREEHDRIAKLIS